MEAMQEVTGRGGAPLDEAAMEEYADWLDSMEKTDPEGYKRFITTMQSQLQTAGLGPGGAGAAGQQGDSDAALFDMLKGSAAGAGTPESDRTEQFKPRFPGDKVMEADGLKAKPEGMHIAVEPGFVIKSTDVKNQKKVFVNVCHSEEIQSFSEKMQLDDQGKEQEGIHVPLSLGAPREVKDKNGVSSLAFDVAVNSKVVADCQQDKTGTFRNFVCELAIEYIDQKYNIKLDARYKLPRLQYRGELPPPKHYIRKAQAPIIQEVSKPTASTTSSRKTVKSTTASKSASATARETATARFKIYEEHESNNAPAERTLCTRLPSIEKNSTPLSPEVLHEAGSRLVVIVLFTHDVPSASEMDVELRAEFLSVKARDHHDVDIFLPYPVVTKSATVRLDRSRNALEVSLPVDKRWDTANPDCGSAPWMLARALEEEEAAEDDDDLLQAHTTSMDEKPKSLIEMFHLASGESKDSKTVAGPAAKTATRWDPVLEDEELPEDRFHRKDMMSMHILEQRRLEREQNMKKAEAKRTQKRAEVKEMQEKARAAGKTWREMYPNEPETTYIDVEDMMRQEKQRLDKHQSNQDDVTEDPVAVEGMPTEYAKRAAAAWSENSKHGGLDLQSALAFELL